jgi:hypothetical protein
LCAATTTPACKVLLAAVRLGAAVRDVREAIVIGGQLGALFGSRALEQLGEEGFDVLGERRAFEHVEHAADREQRVALAAGDRHGPRILAFEARGGTAVDRRTVDLDVRVAQLGEVALDGAHVDADQLGELFEGTALGVAAQRVQDA